MTTGSLFYGNHKDPGCQKLVQWELADLASLIDQALLLSREIAGMPANTNFNVNTTAWHPWADGFYTLTDEHGSVHLVNGRAHKRMRTWKHSVFSQVRPECQQTALESKTTEDGVSLSWSPHGLSLAVLERERGNSGSVLTGAPHAAFLEKISSPLEW